MMGTYYHGGSEIQAAVSGDNLQTLYLMNPNYLAAYNNSDQSHNQTQAPPNNILLLNPSTQPHALTQATVAHSPHHHHHHHQPGQQFIGIPLSTGTHSDDPGRPSTSLHHHYNLWNPTVDPTIHTHPSPVLPVSGPQAVADMGFRGAQGQGLSLSLSPQRQNPAVADGDDAMRMSVAAAQGVVVVGRSKYLKAAQELLDEVVNVVGNYDCGELSGAHKEKVAAGGGEGPCNGGGFGEGSSNGSKRGGGGDQLTTAQRQDLQMRKAKLLNMLDEVEQRYRQYHTQMQVVVSSFEQATGVGSAKSYTSLALKTISKQFRCLKDAITSQIKATSKSLGEDQDTTGGGAGGPGGGVGVSSRLKFVDHQLRQQRALQQIGMMHHNTAWRPQRGLPERAVSVLRAWLFEHFLHPYPKDSDKHMLAKQTGLTRSQVSNWFINARVRLWKPMVEEMYLEEVKNNNSNQEQNGCNSDNNTTTANATTATAAVTTSTTTTHGGIPTRIDHNKDQNPTSNNKTSVILQQHDQRQPNQLRTTTNDMISNMSSTISPPTTTTSQGGFSLMDQSSFITPSPKKQRSTSDNNNNMQQQNSPSSILSMDMEINKISHHHHHRHPGGGGGSIISNHGGGFNPAYMVNNVDVIGRFNPAGPPDHLTMHQQYHGNNGTVALTLGLAHQCDNVNVSHHQQNFFPNNEGMNLGRRLEIGATATGDQAEFCGNISMGQPNNNNNNNNSHHPSNLGYESIDIQSRKRFAAQLLHHFVA